MSGIVAKSSRLLWTPSNLSGIALLVFVFAQVYSYKLVTGSEIESYIRSIPSYNARVEYVGETGGRSSRSKYRLQFKMVAKENEINCDVIKLIAVPPAPIFDHNIKITPINDTCENPYLTDLEFWPRFEALLGLGFTALGGALLVASALWHRRLVMEALARQASGSEIRSSGAATPP